MGQRAYRGKYTDSLVRDYVHNKGNVLEEQYFFSGKPKDVKFSYDLDDPLKDIDINSININRGLLNCVIPKDTKINNLNLIIKSKILGTKISYLHSNLYCLFGTHFIKDISFINISLYNPQTDRFVNERRLIKDILDFMCFKTIKLVNINKNLMYYVIPENSEFAIVLAYKEINYEKHTNFLLNLEDLIFHPYSKFLDSPLNFQRCLAAIDKTIPKQVTNLIMPTVIMDFPSIDEIENSLNEEINEANDQDKKEEFKINNEINEEGKINIEVNLNEDLKTTNNKRLKVFQNLNNFLKEIRRRGYKVISFGLKMKLDKLDDYKPKDKFINKKQKDNLNEIKDCNNNNYFNDNENNENNIFNNYNISYNKYLMDLNRDVNSNSKDSGVSYHLSDNSSIHLTHNSINPSDSTALKKNCYCSRKTPRSFYNEDYAIQSYSEQYIKLVKIFLKENLEILKSFQEVFITFDFNFNNKYNFENCCRRRNEYIAHYFKKMLIKFDLENVTLIHHINFTVRNEQTSLDDQFDYLDYIFFKKDIADDLYKKLYLFKKSALLAKLHKRKSVMYKIFSEFLFDFSHCLFKEGRFDYSFQIMRNSKIVPMQINSNSTMIFRNNN